MLAQVEARRLGHNFVGTEQILLGLIGEGTGTAAKVLRSHGVTLKAARIEVERIIGKGSGFVEVEIPFTPRAKRVLELAWHKAKDLGVHYVGPEHLLMGLVCENEGVAVRVLERLGFDHSTMLPRALGYYCMEEDLNSPFLDGSWRRHFGIQQKLPALSKEAEQLLESAKQLVLDAKRKDVGTDQILLALLKENNNSVSKAVAAREVLHEIIWEKVAALRSGLPASNGEELKFTPLVYRILSQAQKVAKKKRRDLIEIEDLIVAMLAEPTGAAVYALEQFGVAGQFGLIEEEEEEEEAELKELEQILQMGQQLSAQGSYERRQADEDALPYLKESRKGLRDFLKRHPESADAWLYLSYAEECLLNYPSARKSLERYFSLGGNRDKRSLKRIARLKEYEKKWAEIMLTPLELEMLGGFLDIKLTESPCDHTYRFTESWLSLRTKTNNNEILEAFMRYGGFCDCEVLLNIVPG